MKRKIAILGGGMSSLTTAWSITNEPGWQDRYDVTVYQMGWRLGGKGASGRNPELCDRIEEHGLHVLFGFYDNAFHVMRSLYQELGRHPSAPLSSWQEAFKPHDLIVMMEEHAGQFLPWAVDAPRNSQLPGEPDAKVPEPWEYVQRTLEYLTDEFDKWASSSAEAAAYGLARRAGLGGDVDALRVRVREIVTGEGELREASSIFVQLESAVGTALRGALTGAAARALAGEALYLELARNFVSSLSPRPSEHEPTDHKFICWLIRAFADWMYSLPFGDTGFRRLKYMIDFGATVVIGLIQDGLIVPPQDWFKIDHLDFRDWLKGHGMHPETLACPLVSGLYDAIFSTGIPVGAGTLVHLFMRMGFTYRGAVLYKMQAGMGDTVFTPLYTVLERRGVKFEFFTTVEKLRLSDDGKNVRYLDLGIQATLKNGSYDPLVDVKGLPSWPSCPRYEQLVQGDELKAKGIDLEDWWADWPNVASRTLERGKDFDDVVFGISIGAIPYLCEDLVNANPALKKMTESVRTCQTQALQLWFTPDLPRLGWAGPSPIVIPYVEPFDTWADMSQLIDKESWPDGVVGNISYLCSNLDDNEPLPPRSDHGYTGRQRQRAYQNAKQWCQANPAALWPNAVMPGSPKALNWYWLVDPKNRRGEARLDSQYVRAVVSPSERYVLCVPNSSHARLATDQSGFANLYLTGDWILTPLSAGCLEAATMAGLQTGNAITGAARPIVGDWLAERNAMLGGKQ